jgi:hypothetical protein
MFELRNMIEFEEDNLNFELDDLANLLHFL